MKIPATALTALTILSGSRIANAVCTGFNIAIGTADVLSTSQTQCKLPRHSSPSHRSPTHELNDIGSKHCLLSDDCLLSDISFLFHFPIYLYLLFFIMALTDRP